jgi:SAM-dependent methyltransferase
MNHRGTTQVDPYHAIAALYDLEHDPFREDIDLLLSFAEATGGPILEMGCGSGRVVAPLARAGHHVVGIDRSATMLERCRARLAATGGTNLITLVEADMSSSHPLAGHPFGLVLFTLNALMHLPDADAQREALRTARTRLAPGGLLVIDIMNPAPEYLVSLAAGPALEWSAELDNGSTVDKWAYRKVHAIDQVIDTTIWYDQVSPHGNLTRHRTRFELRYLHPAELELMLQVAGFTQVQMYGTYELDTLDDASERIVVTAHAPESEPVLTRPEEA